MTTHTKVGGVWRESDPSAKVTGTHREVATGHTKVAGVWRQFYERTFETRSTINNVANSNYGNAVTLSGQVTDLDGDTVSDGHIRLSISYDNGATWDYLQFVFITDGEWSVARTYAHVGKARWLAEYVPNPGSRSLPSDARTNEVTIGLKTVGTLSTGSSSHTSCSISWAAISGATRYQVGNGTSVISGGTLGAVTSKSISVSQNTTYSWRVRAGRQDEKGTWVYGGWSPILYFNGGRPEIRTTGDKTIRVGCSNSGSWRNGVGWTTGSGVRQGRYSSSNPNYWYGIFDYGSVKNAVRNSIGAANYDSGNPTVVSGYTKVYRRGDVGNRVTATVAFIASSSAAGMSSKPNMQGSWTTTAMNYNQWKQVGLNTNLLTRLMTGQARSIVVARDNQTDYTALNRHTAGSEDGDLWIRVKWNRVTASYIAPRWWR